MRLHRNLQIRSRQAVCCQRFFFYPSQSLLWMAVEPSFPVFLNSSDLEENTVSSFSRHLSLSFTTNGPICKRSLQDRGKLQPKGSGRLRETFCHRHRPSFFFFWNRTGNCKALAAPPTQLQEQILRLPSYTENTFLGPNVSHFRLCKDKRLRNGLQVLQAVQSHWPAEHLILRGSRHSVRQSSQVPSTSLKHALSG